MSVIHLPDGSANEQRAWAGQLVFAPEGQRWAYVARRDIRAAIVSDRGERRFHGVLRETLQFDPHGERWACAVADTERGFFIAFEDGERRALDLQEVADLPTRDESMMWPWRATERVREWIAAELRR